MSDTQKRLNFDQLKEVSVMDALQMPVALLPEMGFKIWPKGTYEIEILEPAVATDDSSGKTSVKVAFNLDAVTELANPGEDAEPEVGSEHNLRYAVPGGLPMLARDWKEFAGAILGRNPEELSCIEILDAIKGGKASITMDVRKYKDKETKEERTQQSVVTIVSL